MAQGERFLLGMLLALASAILWLLVSLINGDYLAFGRYAEGIDLIYLPAGLRMLIVMVFGAWGAAGIFIANPFTYLHEFDHAGLPEIAVNSLIVAFSPLIAFTIARRLLGISGNLLGLMPVHIPVLALLFAATTPFFLNVYFVVDGEKPLSDFAANYFAMVLGDFGGCMIAVLLIYAAVKLVRVFRRLFGRFAQ